MQKNKHFSIVQLVGLGMLSLFIVLGISVVPSMKAMAANTWNESTGTLTLSGEQTKAESTEYDKDVKEIARLALPDGVNPSDVIKIKTSNAVFPADSSYLFACFRNLQEADLTSANTSQVTDMKYMFYHADSLETLYVSGFNTSTVMNMTSMFEYCGSLKKLDLTTFTTGQIQGNEENGWQMAYNMDNMFGYCTSLERIDVSDNFVVNANADYMFQNCFKLIGGSGTVWTESYSGKYKAYAHIDGGVSNPGYFATPAQAELLARLKTDGNDFNLELCIQKESNYTYELLVDGEPFSDKTEDQTYFGFVLTCNAKNIVDKHTVVINKIGPDQSETEICNRTVSVAGYLKILMNSSSTDITTKDRRIAGCILRYGAAAQKYFGYETTNLANKDVDGYDFGSLDDIEIPAPGRYEKSDIDCEALSNYNITYYGMTTSFASNLNLILVFRCTDMNDDSYNALLSYLGSIPKTITLDKTQKFYLVYLPYSIKRLDEPAVGFGSGANRTSISVVQYLGLTQNTSTEEYNTLAKALYAFHIEAQNYN